MRDYEISLWTHEDLFVGLIRGDVDFEGQAYNPIFNENINGEETLSFSIPAVVFNKETGEFEDNHLWNYILNDHKIRLTKDKNKYDNDGKLLTTIHDFVIKNYTISRDGLAKIFNVECKSYAIYELGKVGYSAVFSEVDLENLGRYDKSNINFWMKKLLIFTKNFHSNNIDEFSEITTYNTKDLARDSITNNVYICTKECTNIAFTNNSYWSLFQEGENASGWQFEIKSASGDGVLYEPTTYIGYQSAPNYPTGQPYSLNQVSYDSITNKSYGSLIESNSEDFTNVSAWEFLSYGRGYTPIESAQIEKQRIIKTEKSNVFNIVEDIAEKFSVWPKFQYTYMNGVVTSRKVIFTEEIETDAKYSISYGINLQTISRESNSDELVTKIIVEPVENTLEYGGAMSLSDAPQNLMMEDFLYNFDYYNDCGYISDDDLRYVKYELPFKIRDCNLQMIKASSLSIPYELKSTEIQAQIDFYNAAISAKQQMFNKYQNLILSAQSITQVSNTSFTVTTINNGSSQYIDLSGRKGVIDNAAFKLLQIDGTPISNYKKVYDEDCPEFIKGIRFTSPSVTRARLSFYYNPTAYYTNASQFLNGSIGNYSTFISNLETTNAALTTSIEQYTDEFNINLISKQLLIDGFEHDHFYLIKEGNWKDSEYKLRQEFFSPDLGTFNISTTYETFAQKIANGSITNSELNGAFCISNNSVPLETINFESIRIFKVTNESTPTNEASNILFEYKMGSDFTIDYGKNNSNEKSLLLIPMDQSSFSLDLIPISGYSSKFVDTTNLLLEYYDTTGTYHTSYISKDIGGNVATATRTYKLDFANILDETVEVTVKYGDENSLTLNTDYSLITEYDIDNQKYYTNLLLKPTRAAKFIDQYYNLELFRNITSTFYYNDAISVANTSSKPVVSYTIGAVDLSPLDGYEDFIPSLGQKILINDKELKLENTYGFLSQVSYNLDRPEENKLTVANYKTRFEDLFQRIAAATQQITFKEDTLSRVYETLPQTGIVDPITLQRSFDQNKFILANSNKNEVVWGSEGITLTDVSGSPSVPGQVKLVGNGIFLSNTVDSSGERIWRTGITGDGINASEITTGSLNTNKITIFDENSPRFIWNAEGLYAYSEYSNGATDYNKYLKLNSDGIIATTNAADTNAYTFKIDAITGNASFRGSINIPNLNSSLPYTNYFEVSPIGRTTINNVGVVNNGLLILGGSSVSGMWNGTIASERMSGISRGAGGTLNGITLAVEGAGYFDDVCYFDSSIHVDNVIHMDGGTEQKIIFADSWGSIECDNYNARSDINLKTDIKDITNGIDFTLALKPREFKMVGGDSKIKLGFIAQEVKEAMLFTGKNDLSLHVENLSSGYSGLTYQDFIAPAIQTIQYLNNKINDLEQRIIALENK